MALFNIETDKYDEAKKYANSGELLSEACGIRSWQLDCLELLLEIAENRDESEEVIQVKQDIARIKTELKEVGTLDDEIIDTAIQFTSLDSEPIQSSFFWEGVAIISLILSCALMLYVERINSI